MLLFEVLANSCDGVFAVDRGKKIAFWNHGARRILGLDPEWVIGRPCHQVLCGKDERDCTVCTKWCPTFRSALLGEPSPTREVRVHAGNGTTKWISISTFVLPARFRGLCLLAHVFREASGQTDVPSRSMHALVEEAAFGSADRVQPPSTPLDPLTRAERRILGLLAGGATTDAICVCLGVRRSTVRSHVQHIMVKLGVHTRLEAVVSAARAGLFKIPGG